MVSVRSVVVNLRADISDYQRKLAEAALGAKAFGASFSGVGSDIAAFGSSVDNALTSVNDKVSGLSAAIITLGPAAISTAAVTSAKLGALGTQLTYAATGAAVAKLAFSGVGDALKALDTYSGAPTQANLDALHAKLAELAPAGQQFVLFLDSLNPKLDQLRGLAEQGFLPGLQAGISQVMTEFPVVARLVSQVASAIGDLAQQGGAAFASPFWKRFLDDFTRNASVSLHLMGEGFGNIAKGLAGIFTAFEPLGVSFSQEMLNLSREFEQWGWNLAHNQGFQAFIQYTEEAAPRVAHALGAIASALFAVGKAAAPVGAATLPIITALANVLATIANSPAGPVLIGAAVGVVSLAKALALLKAVGLVSGAATAAEGAAAGAAGAGAAAGVGGATTAELAAGLGSSAIIGGAALGVAAGGLVPLASGYLLASKAADSLGVSVKNVDSVFGAATLNIRAQASALHELRGQILGYDANQQRLRGEMTSSWNPYTVVRDAAQIDFSGNNKSAVAAYNKAADQQQFWIGVLQRLRLGVLTGNTNYAGPRTDLFQSNQNIGVLQRFADQNIPVLQQQFGHSLPQIRRMGMTEGGAQELADELTAYNQAVKLSSQPTQALQAAIAGLDDKMGSTATDAQAVQSALSNLLSPGLNLTQATDAWVTGLRGLKDGLDKSTKSLDGMSTGAIKNRTYVDGLVNQFEAVASAGAGAGESSQQFSHRLQMMYDNLIKAGVGAGIARSDMVKYLDELGLTPKSILTLIQVKDQATPTIRRVQGELEVLDGKTATTYIDTVHRDFLHSGVQAAQAFGGIMAFGVGGLPAIGDQTSQIRRREEGAILWNENRAAPWESFISGDPRVRARSVAIWAETGQRLGMDTYLAGGYRAARNPTTTLGAAGGGGWGDIKRELQLVRAALRDGSAKTNLQNPGVLDERTISASALVTDLNFGLQQLMDSMDRV